MTLIHLSVRPQPLISLIAVWRKHAVGNIADLGQETAMDHPLFALVTVVGSVAVFVFLLQRCVSRDPREAREAVGARLD